MKEKDNQSALNLFKRVIRSHSSIMNHLFAAFHWQLCNLSDDQLAFAVLLVCLFVCCSMQPTPKEMIYDLFAWNIAPVGQNITKKDEARNLSTSPVRSEPAKIFLRISVRKASSNPTATPLLMRIEQTTPQRRSV